MRASRRGSTSQAALLAVAATAGGVWVTADHAVYQSQRLDGLATEAARVAVQELDGQADATERARRAAVQFLAHEGASGEGGPVELHTIHFGSWQPGAGLVQGEPEAVLVATRFVQPSLPVVAAASVSDLGTTGEGAAAWHAEPASAVQCHLPVAVRACDLEGSEGAPAFSLRQRGAPALGLLGDGRSGPDAAWLSAQLANCWQGGEVELEDTVVVTDGTSERGLDAIARVLGASKSTWDGDTLGRQPARSRLSMLKGDTYGATLHGAVAVLDASCDEGLHGEHQVVGFVYGTLYDVRRGGDVRVVVEPERDVALGTKGGGLASSGIVHRWVQTVR